MKNYIGAVLMCLLTSCLIVKKEENKMNTAEAVLLKELAATLDPKAISEEYRKAVRSGDLNAAAKAAGKYFRERPEIKLTTSFTDVSDRKIADDAVEGTITVLGIPYHFPNGRIRYDVNPTLGTERASHEWLWQMNRMSFWGNMADAYRNTKDEKYAIAFNRQVRDWIADTPMPAQKQYTGSAWRPIEVGIRLLGRWPKAFQIFRKSKNVPDETLALIAASMHQQALFAWKYQSRRGNWISMEMNGIYSFASLFPEFKDSADLRKKSAAVMNKKVLSQLRPDGLQEELSPDYHGVVFGCASTIALIARSTGRTDELPAGYIEKLEKGAECVLNRLTPNLRLPNTNDTHPYSDPLKLLKTASEFFPNRTDFKWAVSKREKYKAPSGETASRLLPYSGFAIMRNDWGPDSAFCCFDFGPLGTGHFHQDKLNIILYKGGTEMLFDDGGGQYELNEYRKYAISGADHNIPMVDGLPQNRTQPRIYHESVDPHWITTKEYDYASANYTDGYGPDCKKIATHTREVLFLKPDLFIVSDHLKSKDGQPHLYTSRFHTNTLKIKKEDSWLRAEFGTEWDLMICQLLPGVKCDLKSACGLPDMARWFVSRDAANKMVLHPATTILYSMPKAQTAHFITIFYPVKHGTATRPVIQRINDRQWKINGHIINTGNLLIKK